MFENFLNPDPSQIPPVHRPIPSYGPLFDPVSAAAIPPMPQKQNLLGRVHDALQNLLTGDAPGGYDSLLSQDEIRAAKPGLFSSLFHSDDTSARQMYQQNLQGTVDRKVQAMGIAQKQIDAQKQAILDAKTNDALLKLGPPPNDPAGFDAWARKAYGAMLSIGNFGAVQHLNAVMQQIAAHEAPKAVTPQEINLGDKVLLRDPQSGKVVAVYPKGAAPRSPAEIDQKMKFDAEQTNQILDDFRTETSKFDAAKQGYDVLKGAIANPGIATPFAVLDAYARVINPGAVVRQGTMQVLQEMGAMDDKVRRWISMAQKGQWPADMVQSVKGTLDGIMSEHAKEYDQTRQRSLLRARRSGLDLSPLLAPTPKFGSEALGTPPVSGANKVRTLIPNR